MTRRVVLSAAVGLLLVALGVAAGAGLASRSGPTAADLGFARDMSAHHRQAVLMSSLVPDRSEDPAVELLAYDILTTQAGQVGMMQGWLQAWGEPAAGPDAPMEWMGHPVGSESQMPGMASPEDLERLRSLSGPAFDVEFLRLMREHHVGGVDMAAVAVRDAARPEVRDLAGKIAAAQTAEVELLEAMLLERGVADLDTESEPLPGHDGHGDSGSSHG